MRKRGKKVEVTAEKTEDFTGSVWRHLDLLGPKKSISSIGAVYLNISALVLRVGLFGSLVSRLELCSSRYVVILWKSCLLWSELGISESIFKKIYNGMMYYMQTNLHLVYAGLSSDDGDSL
ncbi:hypothetical protein M5K25_023586 [Dendrobium thyrsiflorum]|uniref:Uncharacterized protein n=1 Tax=Dendrobium thyrsiflorum TaxID=117978 RepID=A0ABD0U8G1_DENTH